MKQSYDPRNADIQVNIDGNLVHRDEAKVSVFDSLVQGGDGCWEGLRVYQGKVFRLDHHLDRLIHSAKALAFEEIPSKESIRAEIRRTLEANGMDDGVHIRLTLSRGLKITSGMDPPPQPGGPDPDRPRRVQGAGVRQAGAQPRDELPAPLHLRLPRPEDPPQQPRCGRSSPRSRPTRRARTTRSCWTCAGFVAETNATHLFMVDGGVLATSRTVACPEGVTRSTVLQLCREHDIPHRVRGPLADRVPPGGRGLLHGDHGGAGRRDPH